MCADKDRGVFYRLAPIRSVAWVLRRGCWSGGNFGVVVERSVLLNSLALCLVVNGCLANRQGSASGKRTQGYPGPPWRFPPHSYPRAGGFSTTQGSPCTGRRVLHLVAHIRKTPVLSQLARTCKFGASVLFFWTVHCAAVGGFAAYGCGVPLAGAARLSPA